MALSTEVTFQIQRLTEYGLHLGIRWQRDTERWSVDWHRHCGIFSASDPDLATALQRVYTQGTSPSEVE